VGRPVKRSPERPFFCQARRYHRADRPVIADIHSSFNIEINQILGKPAGTTD